jgi:hypothetical protein
MKDDDFTEADKAAAIRYCELMNENPLEHISFVNPWGLDRVKGPRWMSHMRRLWAHRAMTAALS